LDVIAAAAEFFKAFVLSVLQVLRSFARHFDT